MEATTQKNTELLNQEKSRDLRIPKIRDDRETGNTNIAWIYQRRNLEEMRAED